MNWELGIESESESGKGGDTPNGQRLVVGTNASQAGTSCLFPKKKWEKREGGKGPANQRAVHNSRY